MKPNQTSVEENGTRKRILEAAVQLFSQKGYDATRVNEIAEKAKVTKGLIYYYFKSKEEILDYLLNMLLENFASLVMAYVHTNIIGMIKNGKLDIEPDRFHFTTEEAIMNFLQNTYSYYGEVLDFVLQNREILRILILESLKDGKYRNGIFRVMDFLKGDERNPIFRTIAETDKDFTTSETLVCFKFFFSLIPLVSFAVYYDDYKNFNGLSDKELRASFLRAGQLMLKAMVSGRDILLPKEI